MNARTDIKAEIGMHVFERAGLGKAPFGVVGFYTAKYQACPGAPVQPGTSCDYCGQGIMYVCKIQAADGREFKVGCDCVKRTGDAGLIKAYKSSPEFRQMEAAKRLAKDESNKVEIDRLMAEKRDVLTEARCPWNQSESLYSYIARVLPWCGASGRSRYLRIIRHAVSS